MSRPHVGHTEEEWLQQIDGVAARALAGSGGDLRATLHQIRQCVDVWRRESGIPIQRGLISDEDRDKDVAIDFPQSGQLAPGIRRIMIDRIFPYDSERPEGPSRLRFVIETDSRDRAVAFSIAVEELSMGWT